MRRWIAPTVLFLAAGALVASGCGSVSASRHLNEARDLVDQAEASTAPYDAVYEYTLAAEFVQKAETEWGFSDWAKASDYAQLASEFAADALSRVGGAPGRAGRLIAEDQEQAARYWATQSGAQR